LSVEDIGNCGWQAGDEGYVEPDTTKTLPLHPLRDHNAAIRCAFQLDVLDGAKDKRKLNDAERHFQHLEKLYYTQLDTQFGIEATGLSQHSKPSGSSRGDDAAFFVAQQKARIASIRQQSTMDVDCEDEPDDAFAGAFQPREPQSARCVPLPLAQQGPAVVAWDLLHQADATEEQIDAVSLFALSLQKRFDNRTDKATLRLPVATATGNHEALWLGGGGVGKTRTLRLVIEPTAVTFFGEDGYLATAQANQAAKQLGSRGRTIHTANGLLATSSLQTAKLALNDASRKKLDRLKGSLGVEVTDELGCVQGDLLHADCLRTTYGRTQQHNLDPTLYMRAQERWGRMPARILSGDFYQLPPVPPSASLVAKRDRQSYEHQQGVALLASVEHVFDFVDMKRFDDPLLLQLLQGMRIPGGKRLPEETWKAIEATSAVSQRTACNDWYEAAYDWRTVSYAMQVKARLQAKQANKVLFYIQAIDKTSQRLPPEEYSRVVAEPNLSKTKKLAGLLPVFVGMEMILQKTLLPPMYVTGTVGKVVGFELDPNEPSIRDRPSIAQAGCVLLRYMPKYIYLHIDDSKDSFLVRSNGGISHPDEEIWRGVIAIEPDSRTWSYRTSDGSLEVSVDRRQFPLLLHKMSTLHGIQGKTADPGMCAHWKFPKSLSPEALWLAHYVILSRPRRLRNLKSFGLPSREIIEGGPPEAITEVFQRLFTDKIEKTKRACEEARRELRWPPRPA
jgi:hypothetical protein